MQDIKTIIRAGYDYSKLTWPGPTVSTTTAAANLTNTAYDSGYIANAVASRIPYGGIFIAIDMPGPYSSTGATGSSVLVFTITFSDDGSTAVGGTSPVSHLTRGITLTYASSVGSVTNTNSYGVALGTGGAVFFYRLPETRHPFVRIQGATTLTTITGCDYGKVTIAYQDWADTEASNSADLG